MCCLHVTRRLQELATACGCTPPPSPLAARRSWRGVTNCFIMRYTNCANFCVDCDLWRWTRTLQFHERLWRILAKCSCFRLIMVRRHVGNEPEWLRGSASGACRDRKTGNIVWKLGTKPQVPLLLHQLSWSRRYVVPMETKRKTSLTSLQ
jgi:hypothetical protein